LTSKEINFFSKTYIYTQLSEAIFLFYLLCHRMESTCL